MVSRAKDNNAQPDRVVRRLVIVESPSKVKNISSYLGANYIVESSVGHIRDLPRSAVDIPEKYKSFPWARLGVNVDDDFAPIYVISPDRKKTVQELKKTLNEVDELYLATDGDREGEAIAWHLLETLQPKIPYKRMVFHEITKPAILAAAANPRDLDYNLVDAQETRRILDRLYGYEVSPVLWKKVMPKLSAGRVQSVATRILVERERERMSFTSAQYWDLTAHVNAKDNVSFTAKLATVNGAKVASGKDFSHQGQLRTKQAVVLDENQASQLAADLHGAAFVVKSCEEKPYTRKPYAPFITSTLQQEASRKLRFSSEHTMRTAQRLYENGFITYMRTDSTNLSQAALSAAREQVVQLYGQHYLSPTPRQFTKKVKNAQEAHEAIRPAGDHFITPAAAVQKLSADEYKLYELIWQRTIASQMSDAQGTTISVKLAATSQRGDATIFTTIGRTITFPGFLSAYVETVDDLAGGQADDEEKRLPPLHVGDTFHAHPIDVLDHHTSAPPRYTEASLIRRMEELGIGRPSTYTSILSTIQTRGYVHKKGSALVPSWVAFAVIGLLEQYFSSLVDYHFTATMEDDLDEIANGTKHRDQWLSTFYFGNPADDSADDSEDSDSDHHDKIDHVDHVDHEAIGRAIFTHTGLKNAVNINLESIDAREVNSIFLFNDRNDHPVFVRVGRYGPYLERTEINDVGEEVSARAHLPENITPDELNIDLVEKLFSVPVGGRSLGVDPETGLEIAVKDGRFSSYITEVLPDDAPKGAKPRTASLFKSMDPATINLEQALSLLSLPRLIGKDPADDNEIWAHNGRYGPYLKKGTDSRTLPDEDSIFTTTLEDALAIYAQPKRSGRQAIAAAPLRELGIDLVTNQPMVVKNGRFGPYVTDGTTNASLRKGDTPENITDERARELLAERRVKIAESPPKTTKRKSAAKTTTKTTKKSTTKTASATKKTVKTAAKKS